MMNFLGTLLTESNLTEEMVDFFVERTNKHIARVQKYAKILYEQNPDRLYGLVERASEHDSSKFVSPEKEPYIHLTWDYKLKKEGKTYDCCQEIRNSMNEATLHHIKNNRHHPEFHTEGFADINRENRDEPPGQVVDATKMTDIDVGEMLADWLAMGEELNQGSIRDWVNNNVDVRWKFTDDHTAFINQVADNIQVSGG